MTEKQYGGKTGRETKNEKPVSSKKMPLINNQTQKNNTLPKESSERSEANSQSSSFHKANKIADEVREFIKKIIKKDMLLLEIADKIEAEIIKLGGKPAFPTNLSINEIAAHYTPGYNDETKSHGLLKVDFGIQVDGWTSDNAISFDLENSEENKKLISASEKALENAIELIKKQKEKTKLNEIGKEIEKTIASFNFKPIVNLSGHEIEQNELHAGMTIPNIDNKDETEIGKGVRALEPFSTTGTGKIHDGGSSGIYMLINPRTPRSPLAREVLEFIAEEYKTLPFCSRWVYKKFSARGLFALRELENNGNLHQFSQLVESGNAKVAQTERTILVE